MERGSTIGAEVLASVKARTRRSEVTTRGTEIIRRYGAAAAVYGALDAYETGDERRALVYALGLGLMEITGFVSNRTGAAYREKLLVEEIDKRLNK